MNGFGDENQSKKKNHGDKNKSKFIMKYRERNTNSDYSWVEDLKTFDKLIFEYVIYLRKKEL